MPPLACVGASALGTESVAVVRRHAGRWPCWRRWRCQRRWWCWRRRNGIASVPSRRRNSRRHAARQREAAGCRRDGAARSTFTGAVVAIARLRAGALAPAHRRLQAARADLQQGSTATSCCSRPSMRVLPTMRTAAVMRRVPHLRQHLRPARAFAPLTSSTPPPMPAAAKSVPNAALWLARNVATPSSVTGSFAPAIASARAADC